MKAKYPERKKYFGHRGNIRYFPFKTNCPNCGKVCIEDFWAESRQPTTIQALHNCHRCDYDSRKDPQPRLLWRRVPV